MSHLTGWLPWAILSTAITLGVIGYHALRLYRDRPGRHARTRNHPLRPERRNCPSISGNTTAT